MSRALRRFLDRDLGALGQIVSALDDDRLTGLEVRAADLDPVFILQAELRIVQDDGFAVANDADDQSLARIMDGFDRHGEDFFLVDDDGCGNRLAERQPAVGILDQDPHGEIARLRIGHLADDLHFARDLAVGLARRIARANLGRLLGLHALGVGHAQPHDDIQLPGIDDLAHRGSDRQGLAKLAGEAVQDAGNRRADRELLDLRLGGVDGGLGHVDAGLGLGDRLRPRPEHQHFVLGLGRLQLQRGLSQGRLGVVHGGFGDFTALAQRPQVVHVGAGFFDRHLGLLDRQLGAVLLFGPRQRLQHLEGGLLRIARRFLLFQILAGDRAVQFHDGGAGFHEVARLLEEMDHPPFGGRGEDGKSFRNGLATPQPVDLVGDRSHFRRLDANVDVGLLLLALLIRGGLTAVATSRQAKN